VVWVNELLLLNPRPFVEPAGTNLSDRTAIITGGNAGIGYATALRLAKLNCGIILACRDPIRAQKAVAELQKVATSNKRISYILLDLASLSSVRTFAAECKARSVKVDYLINNAGAMIDSRPTEDGFEAQFQTNYLGHFLLTNLLIDGDILAHNARIVNLASALHTYGTINFAQKDLSQPPSSTSSVVPIPAVLSKFNQYSVTKLANILFSMELHNRRLTTNDISSVSLHPVCTLPY
jgi:NAD(P)-dependent dehydrogenase (short-subunit alcohol dehydrogenase family)